MCVCVVDGSPRPMNSIFIITAIIYTGVSRTEGTCSLHCKYINKYKFTRDRNEIWHSHFNANEGENECCFGFTELHHKESVTPVFLCTQHSPIGRGNERPAPQMKLSVSMNPEQNRGVLSLLSLGLHCIRMFI